MENRYLPHVVHEETEARGGLTLGPRSHRAVLGAKQALSYAPALPRPCGHHQLHGDHTGLYREHSWGGETASTDQLRGPCHLGPGGWMSSCARCFRRATKSGPGLHLCLVTFSKGHAAPTLGCVHFKAAFGQKR